MIESTARSYLLVSVLVAIGVVVAVRVGTGRFKADAVTPHMLQAPTPQGLQPRIEDLGTGGAADARASAPAPVVSVKRAPHIEVSDNDGHVFLQDDRIREFSPDGALVQALDGHGAPKMASISHLAVYADGIWATDLLGRSVHMFDRTARAWRSTKTAVEPYRAEPSLDRDRLLVLLIGTPRLFDVTNAAGEVLQSFGDLLANQKEAALALDGTIARAGEAIVFAPIRIGMLASFTEQGRLNWLVESVAPPPPPMIVTRRGTTSVDREPMPATMSLAATRESIVVMTRRAQGMSTDTFVDLYRAGNGGYYKSLRLAGTRWTSVAVGGKYLFASSSDGLYRWPRGVLDETAGSEALGAGQAIVTYSKEGE